MLLDAKAEGDRGLLVLPAGACGSQRPHLLNYRRDQTLFLANGQTFNSADSSLVQVRLHNSPLRVGHEELHAAQPL